MDDKSRLTVKQIKNSDSETEIQLLCPVLHDKYTASIKTGKLE